MTPTQRMQWNLVNMGYTGTTSKKSATQLIRWAEGQGIKVHTEETRGHLFVIKEDEEEQL